MTKAVSFKKREFEVYSLFSESPVFETNSQLDFENASRYCLAPFDLFLRKFPVSQGKRNLENDKDWVLML